MNSFTSYSLKVLLIIFSTSLVAQHDTSFLSEYGPVKENETLWSIAKKFTVEGGSVIQTTKTIFETNRGAFENSDINRLKKGSVLKIPQGGALQKNGKSITSEKGSETVVTSLLKDNADNAPKGMIAAARVAVPAVEMAKNITPIVVSQNSQPSATDAISTASSYRLPVTTADTPESSAAEAGIVTEAGTQSNTEAKSGSAPPAQHDHDKFKIRYSYDLALVNDDNIRRAQWEEDIRDDNILNMTLNARSVFKLTRFTNLSLGGSLTVEKFSTFDLLDNVQYALKLKYSFAFASGFLSPVYVIKLDIGGIDSESDIRTSDTAGFGLEMNKWLSDSIIFTLGYKHKKREANSRVFDTEENQLFTNIDIELSRRSAVYLTYHYITGDIVSSATPRLSIINIAEVIEPDDAFGGVTINQFAYRLDADSQLFTLGFNSALTRSLSYDLSLRYVDSEATQSASIYYDRTIFRAGILGRF